MEILLQDLRYTLRRAARAPAIAVLAFPLVTLLLLSARPPAPTQAAGRVARRGSGPRPLRVGVLRRLLAGIRSLPGVEAAALAAPVSPSQGLVCARTEPAGRQVVGARLALVSPDYFRTMGIPLRGREFAARDDGSAPPVAIVDEALARRLWPAADPIGRRLRLSGAHQSLREVVGVAHVAPAAQPAPSSRGLVYLPDRQAPAPPEGHVSLVVRTAADAPSLREPLAELVDAVDPDLPVAALDLDITRHTQTD